MNYKGIILVGGTGSRLFPLTKFVNKHFLNISDKPMFYFPLSCLMLANIFDITFVGDKDTINIIKKYLGNGNCYGLNLTYAIQNSPQGIPHGIIVSKKYIINRKIVLCLGDNIFFGQGLSKFLNLIYNDNSNCKVICKNVNNPSEYGVLDHKNKKFQISEKPKNPSSNLAITGLYFFDESVLSKLSHLKKSKRGEYEITDLIKTYIFKNEFKYFTCPRGIFWSDTGSHDTLIDSSAFIKKYEENSGEVIASIEQIAYRKKLINLKQYKELLKKIPESNYKLKLINNLKYGNH